MCQASILRFSCGHGLLMSLEPCRLGPCPMIKTTGARLPQQPSRCIKCQQKRASSTVTPPVRDASCASSSGSLESTTSISPQPLLRSVTAPLPGVARQPIGTLSYCTTNSPRPRSSSSPFSFTCSSSSHYPTEHYLGLPGFLPHQNHPCPPCQISSFQTQGLLEVSVQARKEFPLLRGEMLVRNGRIREDWESNLTLDKYVSEKRTEEKEMWLHVMRKWTQDLKGRRVLVAEEDGLGLMS